MASLWEKYNSEATYDEYLNENNKLRKQAKVISSILERIGIKKLQEIEKNCESTISARGINFRVYSSGKKAQEKEYLIIKEKHLILKTTHPSPLSSYRGFLGCKHFSKANHYLLKNHGITINWTT